MRVPQSFGQVCEQAERLGKLADAVQEEAQVCGPRVADRMQEALRSRVGDQLAEEMTNELREQYKEVMQGAHDLKGSLLELSRVSAELRNAVSRESAKEPAPGGFRI